MSLLPAALSKKGEWCQLKIGQPGLQREHSQERIGNVSGELTTQTVKKVTT
jgi:hypothetical protein